MKKRVLCSTFLAVVLAMAPSAAVGAEEQISIVEVISDDNASVIQDSSDDAIVENDDFIVSASDSVQSNDEADNILIDAEPETDDVLIDGISASEEASDSTADEDELIMEIEEVDPIEAAGSYYSSPDATVYSDVSQALDYVRSQAILRESTVNILVTDTVLKQLDFENFADITAHTGNPKGGDYLAYATLYTTFSADEQSDGNWLISYYFTYHDTKADEDAIDSEIKKLVSSLGLLSSKSDYEKIQSIYQYITANVKYDYEGFENADVHPKKFSAYSSVIEHLSVCQGFSSMFYRLALEAGIDCRIISSNQLGHAWNIVKLDGKYYLMDTTWDAGTSDFSYFAKGSLDFAEHGNTDDNFQNASFAKKYTLSDFQYGSTGLQTLGTAPDFTMITSDYNTISTSAKNKRAKLLVFYLNGDQSVQSLAKSLSRKTFAGVDIVFANASKQYTDQVTARSEIGKTLTTSGSIIYTIGSNNMDALSKFERVAGTADSQGLIYSPTVFLINAKNQIVYAAHTVPGNLETIINSYLSNSSAPSYKAEGTGYGSSCKSGVCGKNAVWRYANGTLEIIGSGSLYDNLYTPTSFGWLDSNGKNSDSFSLDCIYYKDVKKLVIGSGITGIGQNILGCFPNLKTIWFQGSTPTIAGSNAIASSVTIQYPSSDKTWTSAVRKKIASKSTWTAVNAKGQAAVSAPQKTSISSLTNTAKGVQITWKKSKKATGYYIYRGKTRIATISSGATVTYTDTKAKTNGKKYTYKVIAFKKAGSTIAKSSASAAKSCYFVSAPTLSSVKNTARKTMTVKWKKNKKAAGYQIQYSKSKTFASGNKTVTVKKASTLNTVIKKLSKKTTYYVRIRAYKTAGSTKYYSEWSSIKSVKINK